MTESELRNLLARNQEAEIKDMIYKYRESFGASLESLLGES